MKKNIIKNFNKLTKKERLFSAVSLIALICLASFAFANIAHAASNNPLEDIQSHVEDTVKSFIKIVQILGALALAFLVGHSFWTGNFDKGRLVMIASGIIILAAAKPIITFLSSWLS